MIINPYIFDTVQTAINFTTLNANTTPPWRDGPGLVEYNGRLLLLGGWFGGSNSTNQVWESVNYGVNWTQKADAPWFARHNFGCFVKDGKIFVWGGDLFFNGSAPKDVWVYEESVPGTYDSNDWTQLTSDWGAVGGARVIFAPCLHNGDLYMAGGQNNYGTTPTAFTDIVRFDENTNQWVKTGDLPINDFSAGTMVSSGNHLYIYGGGEYNSGGHTNLNLNVYKSGDNGATWELCGALPDVNNGVMYCNGAYMDNKIWYLNGYSQTAGVNQSGLWYSSDGGQNWTATDASPTARHASGICVNTAGNAIYIVHGNFTANSYVVNAVPQNPDLHADAQAYINRLFPTPSDQFQEDISDLITNLGPNWDLIDSFVLTATEYRINARTNVRKPSIRASEVGTFTSWTANEGYQGAGGIAGAYLDTNFNMLNDTVNFIPTNNLAAVYSLTASSVAEADGGSLNSSRDYSFFSKYSDNRAYIGMGQNGEMVSSTTAFASTGLIVGRRIGTTTTIFRNGVQVGNTATSTATAGMSNINDYMHGANGVTSESSRKLSLRILGSGDIDVAVLTSAIQTFATARGFVIL